ncbi:type I-F CRISPR-associated endoribonuclease Cas6/Csy4 [Pseudorhodoferax sp.]|uniref:type I-F CRISPR-associated endoribonuclease Cas6/Csy4 n=1 Tax=Pseudorhodoferax sp. TaxID=1993553 RepID=UPI0039E4C66C
MDHYLDLRLLADAETAPSVLMNALFGRLHGVLAAHAGGADAGIGVSFPRVDGRRLGDVLRLHGPQPALAPFHAGAWLVALRDHVAVEAVRPVPSDARHRVVRRVQAKSGAARLRRRLMRRHGIDEAEALQRIPDSVEQRLDLPYLQLRSASTGQHFRLFVEHGAIGTVPRAGTFNAYGLSDHATVPWF